VVGSPDGPDTASVSSNPIDTVTAAPRTGGMTSSQLYRQRTSGQASIRTGVPSQVVWLASELVSLSFSAPC